MRSALHPDIKTFSYVKVLHFYNNGEVSDEIET